MSHSLINPPIRLPPVTTLTKTPPRLLKSAANRDVYWVWAIWVVIVMLQERIQVYNNHDFTAFIGTLLFTVSQSKLNSWFKWMEFISKYVVTYHSLITIYLVLQLFTVHPCSLLLKFNKWSSWICKLSDIALYFYLFLFFFSIKASDYYKHYTGNVKLVAFVLVLSEIDIIKLQWNSPSNCHA